MRESDALMVALQRHLATHHNGQHGDRNGQHAFRNGQHARASGVLATPDRVLATPDRVLATPGRPRRLRGFVYDVKTGRLSEVK